MRALLLLAILMALSLAAYGRMEDLKHSVSPNGRYAVRAVAAGRPRHVHITYDVIAIRSGAMLHRFVCTYQPEQQDQSFDDWSFYWGLAMAAKVGWSPDSHYVFIDEAPHHGGEVFIAEIGRTHIRSIRVPTEAIERATKSTWIWSRSFQHRGWISNDRLSLLFYGHTLETHAAKAFEFILHIQHGNARIESFHETTHEPKIPQS